jgi:hypothetical protein
MNTSRKKIIAWEENPDTDAYRWVISEYIKGKYLYFNNLDEVIEFCKKFDLDYELVYYQS